MVRFAHEPDPGSLESYLEIFRRHRVKALGCFLLISTFTFLLLLITPGTYESEGIFFLRLGRESVSLDPTATTGDTVNISNSREFEINTVKEVLQTSGVINSVVERLGTARILNDEKGLAKTYEQPGIQNWLKYRLAQLRQSVRRNGRGTEEELAAKVVTKGLDVRATPRTSVVSVSCSAETPELARDMADAVLAAYVDTHLDMHQTNGSEEFFAEQNRLAKTKLDYAQERIRQLKNDAGMLTVKGLQDQLQFQLNQIEQQQLSVSAKLAASSAEVEELKASIKSLPERVTTLETSGLPNQARDSMRNELYRLEILLQELTAKQTDQHPRVIATRKQIEEARKILENAPDQRTQEATDVNPTHQKLIYDLARQTALKKSYERESEELIAQRTNLVQRVAEANSIGMEVESWERMELLAEESFKSYAEKLEQARITAQLERDQISNVNILQAPTVSSRPSGPNKPLLLIAGLLLATLSSFLLVAGCELLNKRVMKPEDAEGLLEIPVFISLPRVSRKHASLN